MGDIGFTGTCPRRIFRNWVLPAMNQVNLWSDPRGADPFIRLFSDQPGEADSGRIVLHARGAGSGPRAHSTRFLTRSGPNRVSARLVVASDGRVGIGTSAPRAMLDVRGDVNLGSADAVSRIVTFDEGSWVPWTMYVRNGKLVVERLDTKAGVSPSGGGSRGGGGRAWLVPLVGVLGVGVLAGALAWWHGRVAWTPIAAG